MTAMAIRPQECMRDLFVSELGIDAVSTVLRTDGGLPRTGIRGVCELRGCYGTMNGMCGRGGCVVESSACNLDSSSHAQACMPC